MLAFRNVFIDSSCMDQTPERAPFKVITDIIPPNVDLELAKQRNRLIKSWRDDETDAVDVARQLHELYWKTQSLTNGETNIYLMDAVVEFSVEADISSEQAGQLWQESLENNE